METSLDLPVDLKLGQAASIKEMIMVDLENAPAIALNLPVEAQADLTRLIHGLLKRQVFVDIGFHCGFHTIMGGRSAAKGG